MELVIHQGDLQEKHIHCPTSCVSFEKLKPKIQKGVIDIGQATFCRHKGTKREEQKIIYPPKE